jgi:hypothetical protein
MRKRTAGLLGTGAVLLIAGYVAWCGRTFFLPPRMEKGLWMPEEVAAVLPQALEKAGMMRPEEFHLKRLVQYLSQPYEKHLRPAIMAEISGGDAIAISRNDWLRYGVVRPSVYFIRRGGKWQQVTPLEYMDFRNRWNVDPWKKSTPPKGLDDLMRQGFS